MTQGVEVPSHIPHGTTPKNGFSHHDATKGSTNPPEGEEEAKDQITGGVEDFPALCQEKRKDAEPSNTTRTFVNSHEKAIPIRHGRHKRKGKIAITQDYVD